MHACMQWSIANFGMTYPKIRTFAKCQSLAKMEMNQHFGKTNGNLFTYKHKRETDPYTHEHIIILSIHTCMSIIDTLHIHTQMTIEILSIHTSWASIIYIHMSISSIYTWTHPYMDNLPRWETNCEKMERRGAHETGEGDERPETFLYNLCNIQGKFYMLKMVNGWRNWGGKEKDPD